MTTDFVSDKILEKHNNDCVKIILQCIMIIYAFVFDSNLHVVFKRW